MMNFFEIFLERFFFDTGKSELSAVSVTESFIYPYMDKTKNKDSNNFYHAVAQI